MPSFAPSAYSRLTLVVLLSAFASVVVVGCSSTPATSVAPHPLQLRGIVHGGQQPIGGSTIHVYAVSTSQDGGTSSSLLTTTVTTSDGTGNTTDSNANNGNGKNTLPLGAFTITGDYSCPTGSSQVYLVATGGNPGLSIGTNNSAIAELAALGPCGNLGANSYIFMDEVTTVGSLAALYPYATGYAAIGSGTSDLAAFTSAFSAVNEYTSIPTGTAPGPALASGLYASSTEINTLADIAAACINSIGGVANDGSPCGTLFQLAKPSASAAPTDVVGAIIDILKNPTQNVSGLYNLLAAYPPYQPTLTSAPTDWTLPILTVPTAPTFSLAPGTYAGTQSVILSESATGASIYYTTNGTTPTALSTLYTTAISIPSTETVNAIAIVDGRLTSPVASAAYTIGSTAISSTAAAPTFSPGTGSYTSGQSVTLSTSTPGALIYYTTDGSTPPFSAGSLPYVAPIAVTSTETINAIAILSGYNPSTVSSATYTMSVGNGIISTYAGNNVQGYNGDGGVATSSELYSPQEIAVDASGNLYIADYSGNRIRKVTPAGTIYTIAGNGTASSTGDNGPAINATVNSPNGIAVDLSGNVYIGEEHGARVRKITASTGAITTIAGTGVEGYNGDNIAATTAELTYPEGVAVDLYGNVYIGDAYANRVRKVTPGGTITTVAGTGNSGYNGDNIAPTAANLSTPYSVAVDTAGNLFISETNGNRIRKVSVSTGLITTIAGTGTYGYTGEGVATSSEVAGPIEIALDGSGNLYIADQENYRVRKLTPAGVISTIAGTGTSGYTGNGALATAATIRAPQGVAVDPSGNVYIGDPQNYVVRKVTYSGIPVAVAPTFSLAAGPYTSVQTLYLSSTTPGATFYYTTNGSTPTVNSTFYTGSISVGATETINAITVAPGYSNSSAASAAYTITLPPVAATPTFSPVAGTYAKTQTVTISTSTPNPTIFYSTDGTSYSQYTGPVAVASTETLQAFVTASGYSTSATGSAAYTINTALGTITTLAGEATSGGYNGDNIAATSATLNSEQGVALDNLGNTYIADNGNQRVRKVSPSGVITTIAGTGTAGYTGDNNLATAATLSNPTAVVVDPSGNVYIADRGNNVVRKVTASTGIITTIAGTGTAGYNGEGVATSSQLNNPRYLALDASGNLYITDSYNNRIRKLSGTTISTVAGNGQTGFLDNTTATSGEINTPAGIALDASGNLYIGDVNNNRIRKVSGGTITTIAGNGTASSTGDTGLASAATVYTPEAVAVDASGNVYFSEYGDNKIRKITASSGSINTVVGGGTSALDGVAATGAALFGDFGIAVDAAGSIYLADENYSRVRKVTYGSTTPTASAPTFSLTAGTYSGTQTVSLSATAGASIYYTLDGSTPSSASTLYTGAITVTATETINAIAYASGENASTVATATYTISLGTAATPVLSVGTGTYTTWETVTITSTTPGAVIHYTLDGSTPTASSTYYSTGISVTQSETIKAIAVAPSYTNSAVASATYTLNLPTAVAPTFSLPGGHYTPGFTNIVVTLSSTTPGATFTCSLGNQSGLGGFYMPTTTSFDIIFPVNPLSSYGTVGCYTSAPNYYNSSYTNATYYEP